MKNRSWIVPLILVCSLGLGVVPVMDSVVAIFGPTPVEAETRG